MDALNDIPSDLLARFVAGEADAAERAQVQQWAAADPAHARELERFRTLWDWTGTEVPGATVDVDRAWHAVQARMDGRGRVISLTRPYRWLAAAAVLAGLFFGLRILLAPAVQEYAAITPGEYLTTHLADSSYVALEPGGRLRVRMGKERDVELEGVAYFEVVRDTERPFTVHAGAMDVRVLGTAFQVVSPDTGHVSLVHVREGTVRVSVADTALVLEAGEHARYDRATQRLTRVAPPTAMGWGARVLQFHEAPMDEVIATLMRLYPVNIQATPGTLTNCRLTASFDDEPIDRVLQVIADTFGLQVTEDPKGTFLLDGEGC